MIDRRGPAPRMPAGLPCSTKGRTTPSRITSRQAPAVIALALCALTLTAYPAQAARMQDAAAVTDSGGASRSPDSLAARLERAEEAIVLLREQLATQAQSAVETRSRARFELFGRVLMNAWSNSRRSNNADIPLFVLPSPAPGPATPSRGVGMAIRQTTLGGAVTVSEVLGGRFRGDLEADFFGGQQPSSGGRHFPLLRLRTARGVITWRHGELLAGQDSPLIAPLSPTSVASVGTPGFTAAGNLWLWLPQLRLTGETGGRLRVALQGAMLAPASGDPATAFDTDHDVAELSRRPFLQARMRVRWGVDEEGASAGEVGVSAHRGWYATAGDSLLASRAVAADLRVPIGPLELRGEAYRGRLLRGLGGGAIGQNLGAPAGADPARPVDATAGWLQLNLHASRRVIVGAGCGADDPDDEDRPLRRRNTACAAHMQLRPSGPLVVGVEYRGIETRYAAETTRNGHVNAAIGFEF